MAFERFVIVLVHAANLSIAMSGAQAQTGLGFGLSFRCGSTSLFGDLTKSDRAVDGIFGFGRQDLSVISQLSSRGITPKVFSHCLRGEGNGGGVLVLGEILDPRIVYTPLVPSQYVYFYRWEMFCALSSIAVNGEVLPIDPAVFTTSGNQGTIVDSGTTLAYLVEGAYDPFVSAISSRGMLNALDQITVHLESEVLWCEVLSMATALIITAQLFLHPLRPQIFSRSVNLRDFTTPKLVLLKLLWGASMILPDPYQRLPSRAHLGYSCDEMGSFDLVLKDKIFVLMLGSSKNRNDGRLRFKDEFMNAGQLSVSSSLSTGAVFKVMHKSNVVLMLHLLVTIGCLFL
ncbi:Aspartic proteinase-like protein 2 [Sesamum angolense]|uniref:Aspartic proteinase-like protein 2 n=1 Tax=Sesamum angolense TaxID=2727404 RepID=A0AAE1WNL1_9LAMI|nr:Aspartic proteinase-like protein 2 [Sesamum angolense]